MFKENMIFGHYVSFATQVSVSSNSPGLKNSFHVETKLDKLLPNII